MQFKSLGPVEKPGGAGARETRKGDKLTRSRVQV